MAHRPILKKPLDFGGNYVTLGVVMGLGLRIGGATAILLMEDALLPGACFNSNTSATSVALAEVCALLSVVHSFVIYHNLSFVMRVSIPVRASSR